jgi:Pregnancy-associated plasma protein-A
MKRVKLSSTLVLAVAVYAAATVGTASGARAYDSRSVQAWDCNPLAPSVQGRGGVIREPVLDQVHSDLPARAKGRAGSDFAATVPVWFHVVTNGAVGNVTKAEIAGQIRVLNVTFSGGEGGADAGFTFELAGVTRTSNAKWFKAGPGGIEHEMKRALHRGGPETLNIYSTSAGAYLGWAYFPPIVDSQSQTYLDGVVIAWETIPGTSDRFAGAFDQGETATHEVGHWLNLEHTFAGGCGPNGDFVADTPAEKTPTSGCPEGKDTCPEPGLDPIHNYMDYSFDSCYTEFTPGQVQRMRDAWLFYRVG